MKDKTHLTRKRYQRISPVYDILDAFSELRYRFWRSELWGIIAREQGKEILEVGVGTGKNIPYYPANKNMNAIDLTPGMLKQAKERLSKANIQSNVTLNLGDVQHLDFEDNRFDLAVATFVFCSVPDPQLGLSELRRVVKPGGKIYLLEHMRSSRPLVGKMMDILDPITTTLLGVHINRRTLDTVKNSGLEILSSRDLWFAGIYKFIVAQKTA